jgi:Family of unknown function (DUF6455)
LIQRNADTAAAAHPPYSPATPESAMPISAPYPVVRSLIERLTDWLQTRRTIGELSQLDIAEFGRISAELGLAPAELDALVHRGPRAADEMPKLLRTLGFDEAAIRAIQPVQRQSMERACAGCQHKAACSADLAAGTAATHYESYCNNAAEISAMANQAAK